MKSESTTSTSVMKNQNSAGMTEYEIRLLKEKLFLVCTHLPPTLAGGIISGLAIVYILWKVSPQSYLLAWIAISLILAGLRLYSSLKYCRVYENSDNTIFWRNIIFVGTIFSGLNMGIGVVVVFPPDSLVHQVFLAFISGGLTAGAVTTYSSFFLLAPCYFLPAMLPLILRFFMEDNEISWLMGGMMLLFMTLITLIGRNISQSVSASLKLRFENEELVAYLSEAKSKTESLNEELKSEIQGKIKFGKALQESEEKFRGLVENATDGIVLLEDNRIVYANRASAEMIGYSEEEIISLPIVSFMADSPLGKELFFKRFEKEKKKIEVPNTFEAQIKNREGKILDVIISSSRLELGGKRAVIAMIKDISERKRAEIELRKSKENAEEATRIKDKFVSLVAHNLKSPLTSISGIVDILSDDNDIATPEEKKELFQVIKHGYFNLMQSIDDLLSIDRMQTGEIVPVPKFFDISVKTKDIISLLDYLAQKKKVTLVNDVPKNTRIFADPILVGKVIQNLLSNAIKFCNQGGLIRIYAEGGRSTTISFSDSGIGIPDDILPDIFNPRVITTSLGTDGEKGTGQGLPFCQEIMEAHGGEITVEKGNGQGTTFHLTFPEKHLNVLLVGKNCRSSSLPNQKWNEMEVDFFEVDDGKEALTLLDEQVINLIVTENDLPGEKGIDLIHQIRKNPKTFSTPLIFLTDPNDLESFEDAIKRGASDIMIKPILPDNFSEKLKHFFL